MRANRAKAPAFRFQAFSRKQRQILDWWCEGSPVRGRDGIIADGAIRSGKTVSMCTSFVMWAMSSFNGENFIMCGKTVGSFERNVLSVLSRILPGRGYSAEYHRSEHLMVVTKGTATNAFYIFGGRDESSQDLVQGITAAGAFFDEVALMPESFVNQATGRCSVDGSKFWFNCNPAGPYHWFKTGWIDRSTGYMASAGEGRMEDGQDGPTKDLLYLHFTMDDNPSLSEHIRERYRSQYTGVFYQRYILGLWKMAEGVVYDMFDEERHVRKLKEYAGILKDGAKSRYVSIDYGTLNPTAMLLWNQGSDGVWYCIREYYYSGRDSMKQKTDSEYADDLHSWLEGTAVRAVIIDPSAASFIAEVRKRGLKVLKGKNDVLDGIRITGAALTLGKIAVSASCRNVIREFGSYVWDVKAAEKTGKDQVIKTNDHAMDAMRYFVYTVLGNQIARILDKKSKGLR
jgi:PBSX family phage terminase large subunit